MGKRGVKQIENSFKEITSVLYGGQGLFSKAHDPYESHIVLCNASDSCPLYKNKQCLMAKRLNLRKCVFGKLTTEKGTSYRAKSYYDLKSKTTARDTYGKLDSAEVRFAHINGYYFLDTVYVRIWGNTESDEYKFTSPYDRPYSDYASEDVKRQWKCHNTYHFFKEDELTADILKMILSFCPRPLFGGVITDYQSKIVPQMKAEILKYAPTLARDVGIESVSYVGMIGKLVTLNAPIDFVKDGLQFHWDGEYVITTDTDIVDSYRTSTTWTKAIGSPVETFVKFKPFDELFVEIKDNGWVNPDSVVKMK